MESNERLAMLRGNCFLFSLLPSCCSSLNLRGRTHHISCPYCVLQQLFDPSSNVDVLMENRIIFESLL